MKIKIRAIVFCLVIPFMLKAQQPETIYSIAKVSKTHEWYVQQAGLWWNETQKNLKNEEAWFNYFKACRMAKISAGQPTDWKSKEWVKESGFLKEGDEIIALTDRNIPDSFTANFIKWWNKGADPSMFRYLKRAHEINPASAEMYDDFVTYYETQSDFEMRKNYNSQWFLLNDISPGLLALNYNMLITAKPGSVIITGGDNDTYPAWMLQDAQGVCTDVQVINLHILNIEEYRNNIFRKYGIPLFNLQNKDGSTTENNKKILAHLLKNKPANLNIYLSLFLWKGYYADFEDKLYIAGNLLLYSEKPVNNIALLEDNYHNKYALDYLKFDATNDVSKEIVNQMNVNYLPGLIKLYEHYVADKQKDKADEIKKVGFIIAEKTGDQCREWVMKAFNEK